MGADKFRFFSKVRMETANDCIFAGFTVSGLVFKAVDTAFSRAERTGFQSVGLTFHLYSSCRP